MQREVRPLLLLLHGSRSWAIAGARWCRRWPTPATYLVTPDQRGYGAATGWWSMLRPEHLLGGGNL